MFNKILMVCVGNICRSPMAEGLFKERLKDKEGFTVNSAGVGALVGRAAVPEAQNVMRKIGIDISEHRAQQIDVNLVNTADLILVMEKAHKQIVEKKFSMARGRTFLLGHWSNFEIFDPYQEPEEAFCESLTLIEKAWLDWQKRLVGSKR